LILGDDAIDDIFVPEEVTNGRIESEELSYLLDILDSSEVEAVQTGLRRNKRDLLFSGFLHVVDVDTVPCTRCNPYRWQFVLKPMAVYTDPDDGLE
jgi:hypothetical protein